MKKIQLTKGYEALVDDEDFERINKHKWHARSNRIHGLVYAARSAGKTPDRKTHWMHREIMNTQDGMETDHINRDGLDNRKSNLRVCTRSQNARNAKRRVTNTSGHKGVSWDKERKKWHAEIMINYKKIHLGRFDTVEEAAAAYDQAAEKYHKDFARTNKKGK